MSRAGLSFITKLCGERSNEVRASDHAWTATAQDGQAGGQAGRQAGRYPCSWQWITAPRYAWAFTRPGKRRSSKALEPLRQNSRSDPESDFFPARTFATQLYACSSSGLWWRLFASYQLFAIRKHDFLQNTDSGAVLGGVQINRNLVSRGQGLPGPATL